MNLEFRAFRAGASLNQEIIMRDLDSIPSSLRTELASVQDRLDNRPSLDQTFDALAVSFLKELAAKDAELAAVLFGGMVGIRVFEVEEIIEVYKDVPYQKTRFGFPVGTEFVRVKETTRHIRRGTIRRY